MTGTNGRGVVASGGFTTDGRLQGWESAAGWTEKQAAISARFAATGMNLLETIALGYEQISGRSLTPVRGWTYVGGEAVAVVEPGRWTVLRAEEAGFAARPTGDLVELLERCGAEEVGETDAEGCLIARESRGGLSEEHAALGARFVHTVTLIMTGVAEIYSILSGLDWRPAAGWVYAGGDALVAAGGRRWLLVPTAGNDLVALQRNVLR